MNLFKTLRNGKYEHELLIKKYNDENDIEENDIEEITIKYFPDQESYDDMVLFSETEDVEELEKDFGYYIVKKENEEIKYNTFDWKLVKDTKKIYLCSEIDTDEKIIICSYNLES